MFLVLGGYDVTYIKELNYGSFSNPVRAFCAKYSIKKSFLNLPVVETIANEATEKVPAAKIQTLYTGYSERDFFMDSRPKEKIVLTVGAGDTIKRLKIKGIAFFCRVAGKLPGYKFIAIGIGENVQRYIGEIPANLAFIDRLPQQELLEYYQRAKVYTQFSVREGLPNVVCEAMLCECIPVGMNVGGIPTAIGDAGFICKKRDSSEASEFIRKAMDSDVQMGKRARKRIIDNFHLDQRKTKLVKIIEKNTKG